MVSGQRVRPKPKVFVDSSVLIAAAISPTGSARDLILKSLRGEVEIIISDLVLEEVERNLLQKAPAALPAYQLFVETLKPEIIKPSKSLISKAAKVTDVKDASIVAGALKAKADFLASFDRKHLLKNKEEIEEKFQIRVVTPDEIFK